MSKIQELRDKKDVENYVEMVFPAISKNEKLARNLVSAVIVELNPNVEELTDIKTAVSEAVTNSVVHGYIGKGGDVRLVVKVDGFFVYIRIEDYGTGIEDIEKAREPFFTTGNTGERSGMGFTVMESFMDEIFVFNRESGSGLVVEMVKEINSSEV